MDQILGLRLRQPSDEEEEAKSSGAAHSYLSDYDADLRSDRFLASEASSDSQFDSELGPASRYARLQSQDAVGAAGLSGLLAENGLGTEPEQVDTMRETGYDEDLAIFRPRAAKEDEQMARGTALSAESAAPPMSQQEAEDLDRHLAEELSKLLADGTLSSREKAKRFAKRFAERVGIAAKKVLWISVCRWLHKNAYRIANRLLLGTIFGAALSMTGPLLGAFGFAGSAAYLGYTAGAGMWTVLASALSNGLIGSAVSVGTDVGSELLRQSGSLGPFFDYNLIGHPAIQKLLETMHVPESMRKLTLLNMLRGAASNYSLFANVGRLGIATLGDPDDPLTNFAYSKALQGLFAFGLPAAKGSYRAAKSLAAAMVDGLSKVPEETLAVVRESPAIQIPTKARDLLFRTGSLGAEAPAIRDEVVEAVRDDLNDPAVREALPKISAEAAQAAVADFDRAVREQLAREPLDADVSEAIFRKVTIERVEAERESNLSRLAVNVRARSSALIAGAFMLSVMAARSASPETIASLLPSVFGDAAKELAKSAVANAQQHVSAEMLMYQMLTNVVGIPSLIEKAGALLPGSVRERLRALERKIGKATKGLLLEKHPYVREFFSLLVGRRIYGADEVGKMTRGEMLDVLKGAGTKFGAQQEREISAAMLRRAVSKLQEENVSAMHRILFQAASAQLLAPLGTALASKSAAMLMEQGRHAVGLVVGNPLVASKIGLTAPESEVIKKLVENPEQDVLGLAIPGTVKDAAGEVALKNGPDLAAGYTGMLKIESFFGLRKSAPDSAPQTTLANKNRTTAENQDRERERQKAERRNAIRKELAGRNGYDSWEAYVKGRPARQAAETKKRLNAHEEALARAKDRQARRLGERDAATDKAFAEDLRAQIENNQLLKDLGFLEHFDAVLAAARGHGSAPLQMLPEQVPTEQLPDYLLGDEVAKALDLDVLPLGYWALQRTMSYAEASSKVAAIPVLGPLLAAAEATKEAVNTAADIYNFSTVAGTIAGAVLESQRKTAQKAEDRYFEEHFGPRPEPQEAGLFERMMPKNVSLIDKIPDITSFVSKDPRVVEFLESKKVNVGEVVGKAVARRMLWGTSDVRMFMEILGPLSVGQKESDTIGAATKMAAEFAARMLGGMGA